MGRAIGGVVAAFVLWTVLWLGFTSIAGAALPEIIVPDEPLTHVGVLSALLIYSAVISLAAGYVCAAVRKESPMKTVWIFALILLTVGLFVEITFWDLMPAWYHLIFLALIVPATVRGGNIKADGVAAAA